MATGPARPKRCCCRSPAKLGDVGRNRLVRGFPGTTGPTSRPLVREVGPLGWWFRGGGFGVAELPNTPHTRAEESKTHRSTNICRCDLSDRGRRPANIPKRWQNHHPHAQTGSNPQRLPAFRHVCHSSHLAMAHSACQPEERVQESPQVFHSSPAAVIVFRSGVLLDA